MKQVSTKKYLIVTAFNVIITLAEFVGATISGSLSLLSDALHNLSDVLSIILALLAHLIAKKARNSKKTFGYDRAETLAAYTNGVVLLVLSLGLMFEGLKRFSQPEIISAQLMFGFSLVGLIGNLCSMLVLLSGAKHNLNAKALFLNMLSDTLASVAVLVGSLAINYLNWTFVDPLLTIIVALFLSKEAFSVIKEASNVLMEGNPNINLTQVKDLILSFDQVKQVHHLHVWKYDDRTIMLDAHLNVNVDLTAQEIEQLNGQISSRLNQQLGINHTTLQIECSKGLNQGLLAQNKQK